MATVMATGNADMENAAVELVNPMSDANVVMIGCGPGVGVVAAARRASNGMVIGLDPSEVMVERTRTRCRRVRVEHLTKVERAAAESIPLPDHSQDAVVSVNNIQLWSDRSVGLDECVRVLVPDGDRVLPNARTHRSEGHHWTEHHSQRRHRSSHTHRTVQCVRKFCVGRNCVHCDIGNQYSPSWEIV